jgi:hypothetical protein
MTIANFRFYAELNDLLPPNKRFKDIRQEFKGRQTVKHLIESQGIPHTEVDLIIVNGSSVDFSYIPQERELISVYPVFETLNITALTHLRPSPLREPRFILDGHLGRLAAYLRMLGFDTLYRNDFTDEELASISVDEKRILLTRDRGLLKRDLITHGFLITTRDPRQQLLAVVNRFDLFSSFKPFTRCITCNGLLLNVKKQEIIDQLKTKTKKYFDIFKRCENCGNIYWKGSHHDRMSTLIKWLNDSETNKP